jgi:hypothetical protein
VERRAAPQQLVDEWPHPTEHVLAVVEHDETVELPEPVGQGVDDRAAELLAEAEHLGELGSDTFRVTDRRELDTPHPVGSAVELGPRHLVRQPGLAAPTRSRDRQQALFTDSDRSESTSAVRPTKLDNGNDRLVRPATCRRRHRGSSRVPAMTDSDPGSSVVSMTRSSSTARHGHLPPGIYATWEMFPPAGAS